MSTSTYTSIFVGTGIMLLIGILDMPWGYYELLRWVAVAAGVLLIVRSIKLEKSAWAILGGLAILFFFPPFGISFEKEIWVLFDLAFGIAFIASGLALKKIAS
jgi:hypothetical protein